ncbi:TPA: hypothetical protein L9L57_005690 [Klebsiella pneumoniae]|nr:hypothetical protein [Klebsiella pneumoniae]HBR1478682.1 hypothetical protein [Klebsiella pneumoniae]
MKNNIQKSTPFDQEAAISGVPLPENTDINVRSWHKADIKDYSIGCRVSGMEAPDEAACICGVKWRRKPGVAGYLAINSATLPPALISLNPLTAMKKLK